MEIDLLKLLTGLLIRFGMALFTFGIVYGIDKLTKQNNEWDLKYIMVVSLLFSLFLTILEAVGLLWYNDWKFTWYVFLPLIQFILIFEKKEAWNKLSDEEKEKILLSEDDISGLVRGVEKLVKEGETADSILEKIKKD